MDGSNDDDVDVYDDDDGSGGGGGGADDTHSSYENIVEMVVINVLNKHINIVFSFTCRWLSSPNALLYDPALCRMVQRMMKKLFLQVGELPFVLSVILVTFARLFHHIKTKCSFHCLFVRSFVCLFVCLFIYYLFVCLFVSFETCLMLLNAFMFA